MNVGRTSHPGLAPATREQRRRAAFVLDDYVDNGARILEIGPGDGWLGAYLIHSGFLGYRRLHSTPPADFVGELARWRDLGLAPASFDLVIAFDGLLHADDLTACHELLAPGGFLFALARRPGRERVARWLAAVGLERRQPELPTWRLGSGDLRGWIASASRHVGPTEMWWRLRKPLDPAG